MLKPILYSSARSPHCFKVSMILEEKGVAFERIEINLSAKEQKTPAYLRINPLGQVPVYEDDQGIHIDSLVIMRYLDERYPEPLLFPKDKDQEVLNWIERSSGPMREVSHELYWQVLEPPKNGTNWQEVERLKILGHVQLKAMETSLATNGEYLCGELSAADFSVFAWVYGYKRFNLPASWEAYPKVLDWQTRLSKRPSVAASYQKEGRAFSAK